MKKLIFIWLLLFSSCIPLPAQQHVAKQPNALYIAVQPTDWGIGVRYDHAFNGVGAYASISYGNYNISKYTYIKDHVKYTIGVSAPIPDWNDWHYAFNAGLNYHDWGKVVMDGIQLSDKIFNPWSFELGVSVKLPHFALGLRTDIMRWEPCIDVGMPFKYRKR
jgi:hypothetical protein